MDESRAFSAPSWADQPDDAGPIPTPEPARSAPRPLRAVLVGAVAAFLLGSALTYYAVSELDWPEGPDGLAISAEDAPAQTTGSVSGDLEAPAPLPTARQSTDARRAALAVAQVAQQQGGIDQRVAAMEQRLARLDLQAQAAAGNASRAEGLLIAFAARRAIERGAALGYLDDQLRLRFGDAQPNAVAAVQAAGEEPVTIDQLLARLEGLEPVLTQVPADEGVLPRIGRELSQLFVIRSEETPSPRPQSRLVRARQFLESGRVEAAVAEVGNMPNAGEALAWIEDAERYARALRGLELLETTAILEPRRLRDGSGNTVEQPSPAA